jgi:hypothetical protein
MANHHSLARIMYGTTTEERYLPPTSASSAPLLSTQSQRESGDSQDEQTDTLGALLHRAWNNISGKH